MKKFFLSMAVFAAVLLIVSCGDSSSSPESQADDPKNNDTDIIPDEGDSQPDDADTVPEEGDSQQDDADTVPYEGDSPQDDTDSVPDDDADQEAIPWPPDDCLYFRCAQPHKCVLDESIVNSDAEHYFGFKGAGTINSADTSDPDWANLVKKALEGIDGKDLDYAGSYSFFFETTIDAYGESDLPAVALEAIGDPNPSTGRFTTIAYATIPVNYIEFLYEYKEFESVLPIAPFVQILDIVYTSDEAYIKQCVIAENRYDMNEVFGQETAVGKTQVCIDEYKNENFTAGEPFKLAMNAELVLVDSEGDAESADLCTCYKTEDWSVVDCSEISWE